MDSFTVLADPSRRRIVELLSRGPKNAGAIQRQFSISQPAVSQHLKTLREAGLVEVEVDAQRRVYRLRQEPFDDMQSWVATIQSYWLEKLDRMDVELSKESRES